MSEASTPEERTELPTERRMTRMRSEGQIYLSTEVMHVASLMTGFLMLNFMWGRIFEHSKIAMISSLKLIGSNEPLSVHFVHTGIIKVILLLGPDVLLITVAVAAVATLAVMLQTNWNIKEKKIHFNFSMLNPVAGFFRIFSINGAMNTGKALVKLALILPIGYYGLRSLAPQMAMLAYLDVNQVLLFTGHAIAMLFWRVLYILIALAIFDYAWGRYQWLKVNKMTKDEVKDERKSVEGDETTKRKIINKGLQRILQRIMTAVPQADVVVTNPTHYAVALKYDRGKMHAPVVVAKGQDHLALRIRKIARENNVPVLERKLLARSLYASTEVGSEIPYDLFKAVAEVLAYVYKLKNPHGNAAQVKR